MGKASPALVVALGAAHLGLGSLLGSGFCRSGSYLLGSLVSFSLQAGCNHLLGDLSRCSAN